MKLFSLFISLVVLVSCPSGHHRIFVTTAESTLTKDTIHLPDPSFNINNGFAYYKNILFSGYTKEVYATAAPLKIISYTAGKEDGGTITFYPSGQLQSRRYYTKGEKDGVHCGWWQNGNKRFEYHFKNGIYQGTFKEWYADGNIAKIINYDTGVETDGKGWRENGKIYMSFVMKDDRRYGLVNAKLCYSLKNEKGEFIENTYP